MKKSIKTVLAGLLAVPMLALGVVATVPASHSFAAPATDITSSNISDGVNAAQGNNVANTSLFGPNGIFTKVVNVMLYIIGALSVIMLIYGGIRYVISGGNTASVTAAKNTILYAIVGIIVAVLAYAIVNFVLGQFTN